MTPTHFFSVALCLGVRLFAFITTTTMAVARERLASNNNQYPSAHNNNKQRDHKQVPIPSEFDPALGTNPCAVVYIYIDQSLRGDHQ